MSNALKRGFKSLKAAKQEADRERKSGFIRDLYLKGDGASTVIWFNGSSKEEPVQAKFHSVKLANGKFRTELCGEHADEKCVFCWAHSQGNKRVGAARNSYLSNVVDCKWLHKVKNNEKSAETGQDRFDYIECTGDPEDDDPSTACKQCKKGVPRIRAGQKRLRLSMASASSLDVVNEELHTKCVSCGGKLILTGYKKGKKVIPPDAYEEVDNPEDWEPVYKCKKCSNPVPGSIFLCPVKYKRSGSGMDTQYTFLPGSFEDPPEWVSEIELINWEETLVPMTAAKMCELLDIDNPFEKRAKVATLYGDDDDGTEPPF